MSEPWWRGLAAAEAKIGCGGREHTLRWAVGKLTARDHSDLDSERILVALGGRCPCVDVLEAWAAHADDLRVLVLASRGPADPVRVRAEPQAGRGRSAMMRSVHAGGPADEPEDEVAGLLGLGGPMQDRLTATVAAAWRQRLRDGDADAGLTAAGPALHAALYGRVTAALRAWTGRPDLPVGLTMIDEGQPPSLAGRGGEIAAALPFGWIIDVWARGLCTVWGRFILSADPPPPPPPAATASPAPAPGEWVVSAVGPDLGPQRPIRLPEPPAD